MQETGTSENTTALATVVIPNYNGMAYLKDCLASLRKQRCQQFTVHLIDNGSSDGSVEFAEAHYPEVKITRFAENQGFCRAVNEGIAQAETPYVILLNNDTWAEEETIGELVKAMEQRPKCFSCSAKMIQMYKPELIDDAGDYYCAFGWAYARGKGNPAEGYNRPAKIFAACAGAAIYRTAVFREIGSFDEVHFAYLEDIDIGYRARIQGYENWYIPTAVVHHVGSAFSGSPYNSFKIRHSSRNSIYLIYKNMPVPQIILNLPFFLFGFLVKLVFFTKKGFFRVYSSGLVKGARLCSREKKVPFQWKNLGNYVKIQLELWINMIRRIYF